MQNFFKPPIFPDEGKTLDARLLHTVLWIGMLAVTTVVIFNLILAPINSLRGISIILMVDIAGIALHFLNRAGHSRLASFGLIIILWLIFTFFTASGGGLFAPSMTAFFVLVPLAGLLLGGVAAIIAGVAYAFTGLGFLAAGNAGILPVSQVERTPQLLLTAFTIYMIVIVATQYLSTKIIKDALGRARSEIKMRRDTEAALRSSEERYRSIFESTGMGMFESTADGKILRVNLAYARLFGFDSPEAAKQGIPEVASTIYVHPENRRQFVQYTLDHPGMARFENEYRRKDGTTFFGALSLQAMRTTDDDPAHLFGFVEDITERKERLKRAEMLAAVSRALAEVNLDYQAALNVVVWQLTHEIGDTCAVFLNTEDSKGLYLGALSHLESQAEEFSRNLARQDLIPMGNGLIGQVAQTGQAMIFNNITTEQIHFLFLPQMAAYYERLGIQCVMDVPMNAQGKVIGVVSLIRHQVGKPYAGEEQALVQELADRAALTIVNARLYTENRRQAELLRQDNEDLEKRIAIRTAELADLYNHAPCGYQSLDEQGRFIRINDTALKMFGYTREDVLGKHINEFFTSEGRVIFDSDFPKVKEQGSINNVENEIICKDGSLLPIMVSAMVEKKDGGRFETRATVIDNSERKKAEMQIRNLNEELAEKAHILEATNKELEAFTYSVSHDLKAPLRGIDGYSRLLLENYSGNPQDDSWFFLQNIRKSAGQMTQLIDDLLIYSRLERRPLNPTSFNLRFFVEDLVEPYAGEIQERHVDLRYSIPPVTLQVDLNGFGIALRNVIDNAFKYTRQQTQPVIEIGAEEFDHICRVWVKDNGIGFDMQFHDRVFDIFQQLARSEEYPGSGVGLALTRKAMLRLGGKVWAESKIGEGTTFFLEVPK